jgi:hypothetical protein
LSPVEAALRSEIRALHTSIHFTPAASGLRPRLSASVGHLRRPGPTRQGSRSTAAHR